MAATEEKAAAAETADRNEAIQDKGRNGKKKAPKKKYNLLEDINCASMVIE